MKRQRDIAMIELWVRKARRWTIEPPLTFEPRVNPSYANIQWLFEINRSWISSGIYNPNVIDAQLSFESACLSFSFLSMIKHRSIVLADLDSMTDDQLILILSNTLEPLVDSFSLVELLLATGRHSLLILAPNRAELISFIKQHPYQILFACLCSLQPFDAFQTIHTLDPSFQFHNVDSLCLTLAQWARERLVFLHKQVQQLCATFRLPSTTHFHQKSAMYSVFVETFSQSIVPLIDLILDFMIPQDYSFHHVNFLFKEFFRIARTVRLQGGLCAAVLLSLLERLDFKPSLTRQTFSLTSTLVHYNDTTRHLVRKLYPTKCHQLNNVKPILETLLVSHNDQLFDEYMTRLNEAIDIFTFSGSLLEMIHSRQKSLWSLVLEANTRIDLDQWNDSENVPNSMLDDDFMTSLIQETIEAFRPDLVEWLQSKTSVSSRIESTILLSRVVARTSLLSIIE